MMKKIILLIALLISMQGNSTSELTWKEIENYLNQLLPILNKNDVDSFHKKLQIRNQFFALLKNKKSFVIKAENLNYKMTKEYSSTLSSLIAQVLNEVEIKKIRIFNFNENNNFFIADLFNMLLLDSSVEDINLYGNRLKDLPLSILKFKKLKSLNIIGNNITLNTSQMKHFETMGCKLILEEESTESLEEEKTEPLEQLDEETDTMTSSD